MPRAKIKQVVIPKFSAESEEAAWWDTHRSEIEAEIRERMKQKRPLTLRSLLDGEKPSRPVTLRIAKEDLEAARQQAAQRGVGYQTYLKMLLRQALWENAGKDGSLDTHSIGAQAHHRVLDACQEIRFRTYNPYESAYTGLQVVSRETLHLIKTLRTHGYSVVVEPDDGARLCYWVEKGLHELLSDPLYAFVVGIPVSVILGVIANWLSQLRQAPKPDEASLILEFDEEGNKVRYDQSGRRISDQRFGSMLAALEARKRRFEASRKIISPYPGYPIPIHLEHTCNIVGWSKGFVFDDKEKAIAVDIAKICDEETWRRIQHGELMGFSIAGIVTDAVCQICRTQYVECNHIAGIEYEGRRCTVRTVLLPAEISIVKDPVQPLSRIERPQDR
jgi:predicted DNA binding CopG/RHH family protein